MRTSAREIHFEVHVLEGGRWLIDYVTPEEEEAIAEAQDLFLRPEIESVRVIKEIYSPENDTTAARIVFSRARARPLRPLRVRAAAPPPTWPRPLPDAMPAPRSLATSALPGAAQDSSPRLVLAALGALLAALALLAGVFLL